MTFEFAVWSFVAVMSLIVIIGFGVWGMRPEAERFERADWTGDRPGVNRPGRSDAGRTTGPRAE